MTTNNLYFDIETSPESDEILDAMQPEFSAPSNYKDPEKIAAAIAEKAAEWKSKAALSPLIGKVVAVGILQEYGDTLMLHGTDDGDEKGILEETWAALSEHGAFTKPIIGWNIDGFDLPFILKRSWKLGVKVPQTAIAYSYGRAKFNSRFIDMMQFWTCGSQERFTKLDAALKFFGFDGKVDLGDELFYQTYARDKDLALSYLDRDVKGLRDLEQVLNVCGCATDIKPSM